MIPVSARPLFTIGIVLMACVSIHVPGLPGEDKGAGNGEEYEFVEDTTPLIEVIHGRTVSIGKLDAAGNFIPDKRYFQAFRTDRGVTGSPPGTLINWAQKRVYEFRSGRLVPGDIDGMGHFIPTVGGRIIDFKDYRYSSKAPKIYNVPGEFVRKEKKEPN
jgi:hypothetical protein